MKQKRTLYNIGCCVQRRPRNRMHIADVWPKAIIILNLADYRRPHQDQRSIDHPTPWIGYNNLAALSRFSLVFRV